MSSKRLLLFLLAASWTTEEKDPQKHFPGFKASFVPSVEPEGSEGKNQKMLLVVSSGLLLRGQHAAPYWMEDQLGSRSSIESLQVGTDKCDGREGGSKRTGVSILPGRSWSTCSGSQESSPHVQPADCDTAPSFSSGRVWQLQ
ncbi:hypothetical protein INR49_002258 [Caranx melampygus]|nr:hypothetical protein INR49_002258 [Caranx melampygus]